MPSEEDVALTKKFKAAGDLVGVQLLDHIILGANNGGFFSFDSQRLFRGVGAAPQ